MEANLNNALIASVARFLESRGMIEDALEVATDPDYRFELAIQLGRLEIAKVSLVARKLSESFFLWSKVMSVEQFGIFLFNLLELFQLCNNFINYKGAWLCNNKEDKVFWQKTLENLCLDPM